MRVITGSAKGARLRTLEGNDVRPTAERVKEAVFSIIQFDIEGRRVLDLFGGCGQMGIEALSRGAESAVFVDSSQESVKVISDNLKTARLSDKASVIRKDFRLFLASCSDTFDIAFIDPPYHLNLYEDALSGVARLMSDYGIILCEHPLEVKLPEAAGDFEKYKEYRYGKVYITSYRRKEQSV